VATWAVAAAAYGLILVGAASTQPIARRAVALAAATAYSLVALGSGTFADSLWVNLLVPGGLLLTGYWLSGFFFRDPQPWLERWLLNVDHRVGADQWMRRWPHFVAEVLELSYALVHVVIGGGAIYVATFGVAPVAHFWTLVLVSELASFALMPWLRSRPPRAIERRTSAEHAPRGDSLLRRVNAAILDTASIQANTLPSGHASGAVAAGLGVLAVDPLAGWGVLGMAGIIAVAAAAGRYHYVVDCVTGAGVSLLVWSLL
jgi:hypothetical protein